MFGVLPPAAAPLSGLHSGFRHAPPAQPLPERPIPVPIIASAAPLSLGPASAICPPLPPVSLPPLPPVSAPPLPPVEPPVPTAPPVPPLLPPVSPPLLPPVGDEPPLPLLPPVSSPPPSPPLLPPLVPPLLQPTGSDRKRTASRPETGSPRRIVMRVMDSSQRGRDEPSNHSRGGRFCSNQVPGPARRLTKLPRQRVTNLREQAGGRPAQRDPVGAAGGHLVERVALSVQDHREHTLSDRRRAHLGGERGRGGRAGHDQHRRLGAGVERALEVEALLVGMLVEPQHVGAQPAAAALAGERRLLGLAGALAPLPVAGEVVGQALDVAGALGGAAGVVDVAVDLQGALGGAPGPQVQAVDVLGHEEAAIAQLLLQRGHGAVGGVGRGGVVAGAPVEVPAPDVHGHALEGHPGGQLDRMEAARADL